MKTFFERRDRARLIRITALTCTALVLSYCRASVAAELCPTEAPGTSLAQTDLSLVNATEATATVPQSVDFIGPSEVTISLARFSNKVKGRVLLEVYKRVGTQSVAVCETGWIDLQSSFLGMAFAVRTMDPAPVHWFLQVFDEAAGGPTGDPPYVVTVRVYYRKSQTDSANVSSFSRPITPSQCVFTGMPKRGWINSDRAFKETIPDLIQRVPYTKFWDAGSRSYFRIRFESGVPQRLSLIVSAKNEGDGPFTEVCKVEVESGKFDNGRLLEASWSSTYLFRPRWRLQLRTSGRSVGANRIEVLRDRDPDRIENPKLEEGATADVRTNFLCFQTGFGRRGMPVRAGIPFANHSRLNIRIAARSGTIPSDSLIRLHKLILQAAEVWRRACTACLPDNLTLIQIDKTLYAIRSLSDGLAALQMQSLPTTPPNLFQPPPGPYNFVFLLNSRAGTRTPVDSYVPMTSTSVAYQNLCAIPITGLPDFLQPIRYSADCPSDEQSRIPALNLTLLLVDGSTSCGSDPNIVACEADSELIELNTKAYSYSTVDSSNIFHTVSSTTTVDLLHVILHEFGHWVGLGHLPDPGNIMASSLEQSLCVDSSVVAALEQETNSSEHVSMPRQAFFYEKPPKGDR